ncbi:hypothetical protein [Noviherbaspirillum cavernae]|uniref:hypothetical protein n=1 Tax=Noviherbaspirillum cavernae TaxID=2320862 RepID=UPI001F5B9868|nr:hypothetical protein [Noviherbaspirillum cavernae]
MASPLMNVTGIDLKCMDRKLSEIFNIRTGRNGGAALANNKEGGVSARQAQQRRR